MSTHKIIFVKNGGSAGDGSLQHPFSSIANALNLASNNTIINLMSGTHTMSSAISVVGKRGLKINNYEGRECVIVLTGDNKIESSDIEFDGVELKATAGTSSILNLSNASAVLVNSKITYIDYPTASHISPLNVDASTLRIINSTIGRLVYSNAVTSEFSSAIKVTNNGSVDITGCLIQNMPANRPFILAYDEGTKISISDSKIGPAPYTNFKVGNFAIVKFVANGTGLTNAMSFINNKVTGVPRFLNIVSPAGAKTLGFTSKFYNSTMDGIVMSRNYFYEVRVIMQSTSNFNCYYYNNTSDKGCLAFIIKDAAYLEFKNSIVSNLYELPPESRPDTELGIPYPYSYSIFNNMDSSTVSVAYSCLYNNFGENFGPRVAKGAMVRFIDPNYQDEILADLSLATSSQLIDAGVSIGVPFIGTSADIGAAETKRFANDEELSIYLSKKTTDTVTMNQLSDTDILQLIKDRLRSKYKKLSLDPNGPLMDIVVKPMAILLEPFQAELEATLRQQSIKFYNEMSEQELDLLAENYFIYRRYGHPANGTVRVYLFKPSELAVPAGTKFYTAEGLTYEAKIDHTYSQIEAAMNKDVTTGYFYVDILAEAAQFGSGYNIDANKISSTDLVNNAIIRVTNPYPMLDGSGSETNTEFYNRIKRATTLRNIINKPSIETVVLETFPDVTWVDIVGFRESEMQRDVIPPIQGHFGGCADIYISSRVHKSELVAKLDSSSNPSCTVLSTASAIAPILWIDSIHLVDPITRQEIVKIDETRYAVYAMDKLKRFSREDGALIVFSDPTMANKLVKIKFSGSSAVSEVQDFINSTKTRIILGDYMVKHFIPARVNVTVRLKNTSAAPEAINALSDYILGLGNGKKLDVADLVKVLTTSNVRYFDENIKVVVDIFDGASYNSIPIELDSSQTLSRLYKYLPGTITILPLKQVA